MLFRSKLKLLNGGLCHEQVPGVDRIERSAEKTDMLADALHGKSVVLATELASPEATNQQQRRTPVKRFSVVST